MRHGEPVGQSECEVKMIPSKPTVFLDSIELSRIQLGMTRMPENPGFTASGPERTIELPELAVIQPRAHHEDED